MKKPWIFIVALLLAGTAQAQLYKWVDKDGKTRYGDTPPPGIKATKMGAPASGSSPAPAAADPAAKDAKKGPMTSAEREQDYRKRQEDAKKDADKAEQERKEKQAKADDCARTKEYLMTLESGQRIARTSPAGERYFMDENQRAQETATARDTIRQVCTN
jgi:Domain of unknown function (DUF4124)